MTSRTLPDPAEAAAPTALGAFLRGVERRGLVFAWLLAGSREAGAEALAWALDRFRGEAGHTPFGEWSRRFWSLLLAAPGLRTPPAEPAWDPDFEWLSRIGHGPRAALLLRLVAGLAESEAAAVLGIARPTYRLALQRALPHRDDGSPDPEAWRALSDAAQRAVRAVPGERLERIAMLRDGVRPRARAVREATPKAGSRRRWLWPATLAVVALTAAALAATWWWPWPGPASDGNTSRIRTEALPPASTPAAQFEPATALQSHRDLGLLLAQATGDAEAFEDPAFDAWLVEALAQDDAGLPAPPETSDADDSLQEQFDALR